MMLKLWRNARTLPDTTATFALVRSPRFLLTFDNEWCATLHGDIDSLTADERDEMKRLIKWMEINHLRLAGLFSTDPVKTLRLVVPVQTQAGV